ncbi:MAG TPA: LacI family transcriptional regulator [Clostridiales bacterium]|nr:LacI family transcriptional regulator [Clostridiales bacterium]
MGRNITIYTIAEEAGVSVATVSRYLTGNANVKEKNRQKIEKVIEKYNYRPNSIARNLSNQETKTIGILLPDVTAPFFGMVFLEAERVAFEMGYSLLLGNTMNDNVITNTNVERSYIEFLLENQVDGLIILGGHIDNLHTDPEYFNRIKALIGRVPVVMVNGEIKGLDCYNIRTDDTKGINQMVDYLVSLNHEKIAFIGGYMDIQPTMRRLKTMWSAMAKYGIQFNPDWFIEDDFSVQAGKDSMEKLLQMKERPTAVICVNDLVAVGALHTAVRMGLKVPEDISIVGFDNTYLTEWVMPEITSVDIQPKQLGRMAVEVMIGHLEGREVPKDIVFDSQLVIRDSCCKRGS